jgi:hypothetical protein
MGEKWESEEEKKKVSKDGTIISHLRGEECAKDARAAQRSRSSCVLKMGGAHPKRWGEDRTQQILVTRRRCFPHHTPAHSQCRPPNIIVDLLLHMIHAEVASFSIDYKL